jgi:acyl carrier protein
MDENSIDEDMDLGSLGFDSLSCLEVIHLLATRYGAHLPPNFINSSTTIRDVRNHLSSSECFKDGGFNSSTNASEIVTRKLPGALDLQKQLWCLRKTVPSSRTPLILIHDGSGLLLLSSYIEHPQGLIWH